MRKAWFSFCSRPACECGTAAGVVLALSGSADFGAAEDVICAGVKSEAGFSAPGFCADAGVNKEDDAAGFGVAAACVVDGDGAKREGGLGASSFCVSFVEDLVAGVNKEDDNAAGCGAAGCVA